ncbi:hypothetical protein C8R44DRAFT_743013 [Mycena epipterygia]|nr:hypothetical protein C8R44DRAFT_743013 [Mycena epipterygia]
MICEVASFGQCGIDATRDYRYSIETATTYRALKNMLGGNSTLALLSKIDLRPGAENKPAQPLSDISYWTNIQFITYGSLHFTRQNPEGSSEAARQRNQNGLVTCDHKSSFLKSSFSAGTCDLYFKPSFVQVFNWDFTGSITKTAHWHEFQPKFMLNSPRFGGKQATWA